jgi:hypothetical protein
MCKLEQFLDHSLIEFNVFGFLNKDPKVSLMKTFWCKCSQNVCQPDIITTLKQNCFINKKVQFTQSWEQICSKNVL